MTYENGFAESFLNQSLAHSFFRFVLFCFRIILSFIFPFTSHEYEMGVKEMRKSFCQFCKMLD